MNIEIANKRKFEAAKILQSLEIKGFEYLGQGQEGVVFHDSFWVYKVMLPVNPDIDKWRDIRKSSFFQNKELEKSTHFYYAEIIQHKGIIIQKYKFEVSEDCVCYDMEEALDFLVEAWRCRIIIKDCGAKNFRRIKGKIKLIDLHAYDYSDNLFLNMCVRMYIYAEYYGKISDSDLRKLTRSAINNFDLPELQGARNFVNRVFANIIYQESISDTRLTDHNDSSSIEYSRISPSKELNFESLFWDKLRAGKYLRSVGVEGMHLNTELYFEPDNYLIDEYELEPLDSKVSLLIKTCPQDIQTIESNVKHIVKQLSSPNPFFEVVVAIDPKECEFLREYYSDGTLNSLLEIMKKLVAEKVIDKYIVFDSVFTQEINQRWFGLSCKYSHTENLIPIAPQLYAFEQCHGDYILQMDSDVMIGRRDYQHSFLIDMLAELKKNENVLSVGFNICNDTSKEYFGFDNGGFVPEVRMGLLDLSRIKKELPLPNSLDGNGKLTLSWHRSLEQKQKGNGKCSIRGGNNNSFYVHPQNFRKTNPDVWMTILDRVEQLQIPPMQMNQFDCTGSYMDWCQPNRKEEMVVVSCFRNVSYERFLRMWQSLMNQTYQNFGIILYDDCSDNGIQFLIDSIIEPCKSRVTFIKGRYRNPRISNIYKCIHNFISNPQSIIVMLDGDDALIGKTVLKNVEEKFRLWNTDVVVGRMHQTYRLQADYRYPVDFCHPRKRGGNVWQHLKTFRKFLFDSIPQSYFKYNVENSRFSAKNWIETCDDYAFMVPVVEMSSNPYQMDDINYYYERDYDKRNADRDLKEQCIAEILTKEPLTPNDVVIGRKIFQPNMYRVEIDITYDCNLKCLGCNRSCAQMPTKEQMTVDDIRHFVEDSISNDKKWEFINILGGEPTLHPDFIKIIEILKKEYVETFSPKTIVQVVSNGICEKSRELCEFVKRNYGVIIDYASYKTSKIQDYFSPFNDAPIDDIQFVNEDFSKACWVTSYCGVGLNSKGYYACAVCGGIDRIMALHKEIISIKDMTKERLSEQLHLFCRYCGNFKHYAQSQGDFVPRCEKDVFRNVISKCWKQLYKK